MIHDHVYSRVRSPYTNAYHILQQYRVAVLVFDCYVAADLARLGPYVTFRPRFREMEVWVVKVIILFGLFIATYAFALMPMKLLSIASHVTNTERRRKMDRAIRSVFHFSSLHQRFSELACFWVVLTPISTGLPLIGELCYSPARRLLPPAIVMLSDLTGKQPLD